MVSKKALLATLAYADIFDFPLTQEETYTFLISNKSVNRQLFDQTINTFNGIQKSGKFYFLKNRKWIVTLRKIRERESRKKLQIAKKVSSILSLLPSILFIGVSGNLAVRNADRNDDIDLFIIARDNTLWVTRLIVLLLLSLLGVRRKRLETNVADKICVNMIVEKSFLSLPERNLYTAHEVAQILPLFDRERTYHAFLFANRWISAWLPHAMPRSIKATAQNQNIIFGFLTPVFTILNFFAKKVQIWYIRKHLTKETVSDHAVSFHPNDYALAIINALKTRIKNA